MLRSSRIATAGTIMAAALVAASSATATTPPSGNGLTPIPAMCGGEETTLIVSSGAAFYVDGTKYVLSTIMLSSGEFTFGHTYGNRNGLAGGSIECTGSFTDKKGNTVDFDGIGVSSK